MNHVQNQLSEYLISQLIFNMTEVKIEDLQTNFESILQLVGQDSYVNWESFTKSSTNLTKKMEELVKSLTIFKEIQQKRFIATMKRLKTLDVPDLIKTVKAKKLPKQALKTVLNRFKLNQGKLQLVDNIDSLKEQSKNTFEEYNNLNQILTNKFTDITSLLETKIKESGLYEEPTLPKELVSTFKHVFSAEKLQIAKKGIQVQYLPGTVDTLHIKTYAQIVEATLQLIKTEYKRLTQDSRIKQRKTFNNSKEYIETLMEYLTNTEILVLEGQKAIAAKVGISAQKLQESETVLMQRGLAQNLLMIQSTLRTRVKESMVPEVQATLQKAKEILIFQVNQLKTKGQFFKKLFDNLERSAQNYQLIPMLLALTLNDLVFQKYNLEEEEFMKNVGDTVIMTNVDIMNIFRDMELAIIKLMQELGIISPQAGNFMQAQTQFASQNPQAPVGGVPLGSNPLELLQLQQFEQMERLMQQQQQPPSK